MDQNKPKTREEWKKLLLEISPEKFEELCYDILRNNRFQNLKPLGKGGDGGRDIEGELIQHIAKETITQKFWFQCKRYDETPLNYRAFASEAQKAHNANVDRYVVMSNKDMTSDAKDEIKKENTRNKCQISDWTGTIFIDLLWECPNVCKTYFPDEEVPLLVDKNNPKTLIQQYHSLGERFDLTLPVNQEIDLNNPNEVADVIKEELINLKISDINLKASIYEKVSMFFFSLERVEDALMFLNQSLDITPRNENALLNKGYILEKTNQIDDSTACYDEILSINPGNKIALNNKAHNLLRKGELEGALKFSEESLKIDPELIVAIHTKTDILNTFGRSDEALNFLDSKSHALRNSKALQGLKVRLYIALIDLKAAHKLNQEILKQSPNDLGAINTQGVIYGKNAEYQHKEKYLNLAFDCFEQEITANEKFSSGWSNKTLVLLNAGQIEQAEKIIYAAYTRFPKNSYVLGNMGHLFLAKNNPKEALKYFDKALRFDYQEKLLINRAKAYIGLRQWSEAISDADRVLKINPKSSDAFFVKAKAIRHLHQPERAKLFEKKAEECQKKPISLLE